MEIQNRDPMPINRDPMIEEKNPSIAMMKYPDRFFDPLKKITNRDPRQQLPQRLKPINCDICNNCKSVNSFVAYSTRSEATYYKCKKCGKTATRPKLANH